MLILLLLDAIFAGLLFIVLRKRSLRTRVVAAAGTFVVVAAVALIVLRLIGDPAAPGSVVVDPNARPTPKDAQQH
jgi:hypothetical protein